MRGNLSEIDLCTAFQLIELGQRTGELHVETPTGQAWLVFFTLGKITWTVNLKQSGYKRLLDCLEFLQLYPSLDGLLGHDIANLTVPEYACLWALVQRQWLNCQQAQRIVHHLVRETLFDLLSLTQAEFSLVIAPPLSPPLSALRPSTLFAEVGSQLLKWQQLYPHICDPDQILAITQPATLQAQLPPELFERLTNWANQGVSLRRLGRLLGKEVSTMAKALLPYIQQGLIALHYPSNYRHTSHHPLTQSPLSSTGSDRQRNESWGSEPVPNIFCIDDNLTVCQAVTGTLEEQGYRVTTHTDPLQALSLVFTLKPDLILCDIIMPGLDGYELCTMLRQTSHFRHTPIVMLTGQETFLDRVLCRKAGATDYLSKPFQAAELQTLVQQILRMDMIGRVTRIGFNPSLPSPVIASSLVKS
jgi:twitching motility two-component system response regulator PilG